MYQAGGRIALDFSGTKFSPRGKAVIDAAGLENMINENHDGTVSRSTRSKAVTAEITLDRGKASQGTQRPRFDSTFMLGNVDVTIREKDTRVLHIFTDAAIVGTPKLDTESGEVSGLSIACAESDYTQTTF